ncbi:hypothetical protein Nepgr_029340 [Nepenthes gracilis]|uniref:BHLH domain-containing protein n=1 Tax=Nepenthes gracilis TaxID=150966 RepID=A0AAD3TF68_NEPGR|nr:hypothetical protein Nepgr_029340 [Nepenthes gracilis]
MEDFISDLQKFKQSFSELNSNPDVDSFLGFSNGSFTRSNTAAIIALPSDALQFPRAAADNTQSFLCPYDRDSVRSLQSAERDLGIGSVQKNEMLVSECEDLSSSPTYANNNAGMSGRKRKRKNDGEDEKPREVIHVRAKRGQATDSHSLAERVRRERINEKLRVLQDLVPGCYKTMGMAVMLDVIINYVRSLQNQIEFLSMKLSAASFFYDFNSSEAEAVETLQRTNPSDIPEIERMMRMGYEGLPHLHSTWPS